MRSPLTIVIADHHPIFRRGLCEVIHRDARMRLVGEAADGSSVLRLIRQLRPDVAILDFPMPCKSGLQVARAATVEGLPTKLMMLTTHDDEELFNEAMNIGFLGFVLKENAVEDLIQAIVFVANAKSFISPSISEYLLNRLCRSDLLRRERPGLERLTPAESRILKRIAEDRTSKEIAEDLGISVRTVDTHRQNISSKLHLAGSHSLLKFAFKNRSRL